jgi:hypothetical protein
MSNNFKNSIKSNIKKDDEILISDTNVKNDIETEDQGIKKFKIGKKQEDKSIKKSFPLYVDGEVQKNLDKVVKKTGYSRNELINMMIKYCLENLEYTD